jgi:AAA15 family ATPase/GTPase
MIREIQIENFKSISSLKMELGRFNVLIGANGCGKSNILEAIAMGSAAAEDKLEDEFLTSRGIRVTSPTAMRSGFSTDAATKPITITFKHDVYREITFNLDNVNSYYSRWNSDKTFIEQFAKTMAVYATFEQENGAKVKLNEDQAEKYLKQMTQQTGRNTMATVGFSDFIIYAPENKYLRTFEDEGQIKPLGIRGEGLFKYLAFTLKDKEKKKQVVDILDLFDWFEDFDLPNNLEFGEKRIDVKDRFLQDGLRTFDQKSVNEGFLYVLFYSLLFIGEAPLPKFFAIDNIDNALNPKLGAELMQILAKLADKYDKQVIFTTHNPAILDGLNLNDPEQRLFVVSRNALGHTKTLRIEKKPVADNGQSVKLSEQFLRGYIGGLNF